MTATDPAVDVDLDVQDECAECEVRAAAFDGLCLECQCFLHAHGGYDMDGP